MSKLMRSKSKLTCVILSALLLSSLSACRFNTPAEIRKKATQSNSTTQSITDNSQIEAAKLFKLSSSSLTENSPFSIELKQSGNAANYQSCELNVVNSVTQQSVASGNCPSLNLALDKGTYAVQALIQKQQTGPALRIQVGDPDAANRCKVDGAMVKLSASVNGLTWDPTLSGTPSLAYGQGTRVLFSASKNSMIGDLSTLTYDLLDASESVIQSQSINLSGSDPARWILDVDSLPNPGDYHLIVTGTSESCGPVKTELYLRIIGTCTPTVKTLRIEYKPDSSGNKNFVDLVFTDSSTGLVSDSITVSPNTLVRSKNAQGQVVYRLDSDHILSTNRFVFSATEQSCKTTLAVTIPLSTKIKALGNWPTNSQIKLDIAGGGNFAFQGLEVYSSISNPTDAQNPYLLARRGAHTYIKLQEQIAVNPAIVTRGLGDTSLVLTQAPQSPAFQLSSNWFSKVSDYAATFYCSNLSCEMDAAQKNLLVSIVSSYSIEAITALSFDVITNTSTPTAIDVKVKSDSVFVNNAIITVDGVANQLFTLNDGKYTASISRTPNTDPNNRVNMKVSCKGCSNSLNYSVLFKLPYANFLNPSGELSAIEVSTENLDVNYDLRYSNGLQQNEAVSGAKVLLTSPCILGGSLSALSSANGISTFTLNRNKFNTADSSCKSFTATLSCQSNASADCSTSSKTIKFNLPTPGGTTPAHIAWSSTVSTLYLDSSTLQTYKALVTNSLGYPVEGVTVNFLFDGSTQFSGSGSTTAKTGSDGLATIQLAGSSYATLGSGSYDIVAQYRPGFVNELRDIKTIQVACPSGKIWDSSTKSCIFPPVGFFFKIKSDGNTLSENAGLSFDSVTNGSTEKSTQTLTIENNGTVDFEVTATISAISVTQDFSISTALPYTVRKAGSMSLVIDFKDTDGTAGQKQVKLVLNIRPLNTTSYSTKTFTLGTLSGTVVNDTDPRCLSNDCR